MRRHKKIHAHIINNLRWKKATFPEKRVLATLGRKDELMAKGTIDSLVESLAKFNQKYRVLKDRSLAARSSRIWGPVLIFSRLWEEQGIAEILRAFGPSAL